MEFAEVESMCYTRHTIFLGVCMKIPLTAKQQSIYDFIKKEIKLGGYAPSVREICDEVGLNSSSTVHAHLEVLKRKGWIKRFPFKSRKIEILEDGFYDAQREVAQVRIVTEFVDGIPTMDKNNEMFLLPLGELKAESCFMYRIQKNFNEAKIVVGDMLLVQMQKNYENDVLVLVQKGRDVVATKYSSDISGMVCGKIIQLFRWF